MSVKRVRSAWSGVCVAIALMGGLSLVAETRAVAWQRTARTPSPHTAAKALAANGQSARGGRGAATGFRASAVKVDITPKRAQWLSGYAPRQSTGVHDPIYHRVVAFDTGDTELYLIVSDLCLFSPALYDRVMHDLQNKTGIAPKHVLWSVTHTHAAPEIGPPDLYETLLGRSDHDWNREYTDRTIAALIDAVRTARDTLEPARIAFGTGLAMANINRRAKDVDGSVSIGLNPEGPVDRQLHVIRLERRDGSLIAVIANYAMHGTVMSGENLEVSGDGPGVVTAYLENKLGGTALYVNGAAGNLAPIYSVYPDPKRGHLSEFRVLLGDRILAVLESMGPGTSDVSIHHAEQIIDTPRKAGLTWPEGLATYAANDGRPLVRLPIRFVRINDAVIWSAPVEMFCEIAMDVRDKSPFSHTLFFGYTNGWLGYLPTAHAFEEGGYEPRTSPFDPQVEADVRQAVTAFLQGFRR